jgi:hypothetical protein
MCRRRDAAVLLPLIEELLDETIDVLDPKLPPGALAARALYVAGLLRHLADGEINPDRLARTIGTLREWRQGGGDAAR